MPHLGGVISHGKARSTAEQDQIVPIGSIGPIAYRLLDLKDVVRHDLDGGGFPPALRGEDGGEGIGRLVRSGVLRGRIGDDQNGCLEPRSGTVGLHHGEIVGSGICEGVERRRGGEGKSVVFLRASRHLETPRYRESSGRETVPQPLVARSVLRRFLSGCLLSDRWIHEVIIIPLEFHVRNMRKECGRVSSNMWSDFANHYCTST